MLGLSDDDGYNKIKFFVDNDDSKVCKTICDKEYIVDKPLILPVPPKDNDLGMTKDNPAYSC